MKVRRRENAPKGEKHMKDSVNRRIHPVFVFLIIAAVILLGRWFIGVCGNLLYEKVISNQLTFDAYSTYSTVLSIILIALSPVIGALVCVILGCRRKWIINAVVIPAFIGLVIGLAGTFCQAHLVDTKNLEQWMTVASIRKYIEPILTALLILPFLYTPKHKPTNTTDEQSAS